VTLVRRRTFAGKDEQRDTPRFFQKQDENTLKEHWYWRDSKCVEDMGPFDTRGEAGDDYRACRPPTPKDDEDYDPPRSDEPKREDGEHSFYPLKATHITAKRENCEGDLWEDLRNLLAKHCPQTLEIGSLDALVLDVAEQVDSWWDEHEEEHGK